MAFSVVCSACGAGFSIRDDIYSQKVAGKVVTLRCKKCAAPIKVDGTAKAPSPRPGPSPGAAKAPAPLEDLWAVSVDGNSDAEMATADLQQAIATGAVPADAIVWKQDMPDWATVASIPELAEHLPEPPSARQPEPAPAPSPAKAQPAAPVPPAPAPKVAAPAAVPRATSATKSAAAQPPPAALPRPAAPPSVDAPSAVPTVEARPLQASPPSPPTSHEQASAARPVAPPGESATAGAAEPAAPGLPWESSVPVAQVAPTPAGVTPPTLPPSAAAPWSVAAPGPGNLTAPPKPRAYEDVSDDFDELNMTAALRKRPKWPWIAAAVVVVGALGWLALPEKEVPLPPPITVPKAQSAAPPKASPVETQRSTPTSAPPTTPAPASEPGKDPADLKDAFARSLAKPKSP